MSAESEGLDVERLGELLGDADELVQSFKRALVEGDEEGDIVELAEDLWEVVDEIEDVLSTVDFEEVPDAIDFEELPDAVDVEDVPEGLFDEDESAVDLTSVKEAVNLRELWRAVDLTELYQEKQDLSAELDDVTDQFGDDDGDGDGGDDGLLDTDLVGDDEDGEDDGTFNNVVDVGDGADMNFDAEARQAVIEEKIQDAVVKFREMLLATHRELHKLYRANQEKLGQPGRQPNSLNPTAASTMPSGPVPETASLRTSTVPSRVKYSKVENPRRVFAHRFEEETETGSDGEDATADEAADADAEAESDGEEEITLEVRDE